MDDSSSLVLKHLLSDHALKARLSAAVASAAPLGSRRLGAAPRGTDDRGLSPLRPVRVRGCMGGRTVRGACGRCGGCHTGVSGSASGLFPLRPAGATNYLSVCRGCVEWGEPKVMHPYRPARAYTWYQPLYVLYCLWRCVPAYSLVLAAVWLRVARHEEELPY